MAGLLSGPAPTVPSMTEPQLDHGTWQVVFLRHDSKRYNLPPHKAWLGGLGVWRARPDRLAAQDFALLHDGASMWDAFAVRDAFPLPARHEVLTHGLAEEEGKYDFTHGAPRCVLLGDPRVPAWLEAALGQPMPLPPARAVVRYASVTVSPGSRLTWSTARA